VAGELPRIVDEAERALLLLGREFYSRGDQIIREFCPGEFGAAKLPSIPPGFRRVTLVTVIRRTNGIADGRYRRMIAVSDNA
jgi:hypothetical protein